MAKSYIFKKHFDGLPTNDDFELKEEPLPAVGDDEFLLETLYLSVDPYMRPYTRELPTGIKMIGFGVGRVIESKNSDYPVGSYVHCHCGWTTHVLMAKATLTEMATRILPKEMEPMLSHSLGVLGLTGLTAYFGFLEICEPKAGETLFVNAAAGATGSIVGQLGKIMGCRVVGCAGSDSKVEFLKEIGFDGYFNYKTENFEEKLKELCPDGIDCFFDNVGGKQFDAVLQRMNKYGRMSLCGAISTYNSKGDTGGGLSSETGPYVHSFAIPNELKIQGFIVTTYAPKFSEAIMKLSAWMEEGKIIAREVVHDGFDKMRAAFFSLFQGENIGKVVVKVK